MAIKKIDPTATFKVISQFDSAVIAETPEEKEALKTEEKDENGATVSKPTRYQEYMDDLDESKLRLDPAVKPDYFVIRCVKNSELAALQEKYMKVDVVKKELRSKNSMMMFLEIFNIACLGVEQGGKVNKIGADDIGFAIAVEMGSVIYHFTSLGKHLKK